MNFLGFSRDVVIGEVIWRYRVFDVDGICVLGILVYFVILCGVRKIFGFRCLKFDECNFKINLILILILIVC